MSLLSANGGSFRSGLGNSGASWALKSIIQPTSLVRGSKSKDKVSYANARYNRFNPPPKTEAIRVVTDIDDTVVSSGGLKFLGIHLGGVDNRYRRGQFYPGAITFALELSRSSATNGGGVAANETAPAPSSVAVLTARAKEFKFALALKPSGKLCTAFNSVGQTHGVKDWGIGDVYYGSVAEWILQGRKGLRKYKNFELLMKDDEGRDGEKIDRKYIIVGDTGEKDEEAAERVAAKYPGRLQAVFMHQVYDIRKGSVVRREDRKVNGVPFYYFRTYIGAGVKAYRHNLIDKESLKRITTHAVAELKAIDHRLAHTVAKNPLARFQKRKLLERQKLTWDEVRQDANEVAFLNPLVSY